MAAEAASRLADAPLQDPRWLALQSGLACSCGQRHEGMFPIQILHPVGWPGAPTYEPNEALRFDGDFLSHDYCVREGRYFAIRVRLPLQLRGGEPWAFMFTAWASFNRPEFEAYLAAKAAGRLNDQARAQARLVNRLSGFPDTVNLMGSAFQQTDGAPPVMIIHGEQPQGLESHPLIREQREGISLDRMFELYAAYGHDMRGRGPGEGGGGR